MVTALKLAPFIFLIKMRFGGTSRKCTFCIDRITNGLQPACVKTCPPHALQFGERSDLIDLGSRKAQQLRAAGFPNANLYGESELGGLHTLYVLTERPSVMGLPENPQLSTHAAVTKWLAGIVTAGVIAVVPFWLLFRRKKELSEEKQSKVEGGVK